MILYIAGWLILQLLGFKIQLKGFFQNTILCTKEEKVIVVDNIVVEGNVLMVSENVTVCCQI